MKKVMAAAERKAFVRKEPVYAQREQEVIDNATCVVLRVKLQDGWHTQEIPPEQGMTVYQALETVQHRLRHHRSLDGCMLYLGARIQDELRMAAMPHDWIPASVRKDR